jgi:hypothetical protein
MITESMLLREDMKCEILGVVSREQLYKVRQNHP